MLSRNSMNHSFQLGDLGPGHRKALDLLFARPERPRNGPSLIPAGDPYSSRGQRPRKMGPTQGPTLKGSNAGDLTPVLRPAAQGNTPLPGSGIERIPGALPPATILCPCRARKNYPWVLPWGPATAGSRCCLSAQKSRARFFSRGAGSE
jgi:hypothetical protein